MFFEVSEFSFVDGLSKGKEGFVKKRTGDDMIPGGGLFKFNRCFKCPCCR